MPVERKATPYLKPGFMVNEIGLFPGKYSLFMGFFRRSAFTKKP